MFICTSNYSYYRAWAIYIDQTPKEREDWKENTAFVRAYLQPLEAAGIKVTGLVDNGECPWRFLVMCKTHEEEEIAIPVIDELRRVMSSYDPSVEWAIVDKKLITWPIGQTPSQDITGATSSGTGTLSLARGLAEMEL